MKVLILNFYESPENYHLEISFIRNAIKKNISIKTIHNFKHDYSKLSTITNINKFRTHYLDININKLEYDIVFSIDFPWKMDKSAIYYLKMIKETKSKKVMITNHLLPKFGHSKFYDKVFKTNFFTVFEKTYIFDFEDENNYPKCNNVIKRKYYIDSNYYKPFNNNHKKNLFPNIFSAGSKGRDYKIFIDCVSNKANLFIVTNKKMELNEKYKNVYFIDFNSNMFNLKKIISECDFTVLPISDEEKNKTAGIAIAFMSMAMAKPVLIRRTEFIEKYIKDGKNGFLYNKISELKNKIDKIFKIKNLYNIGIKARKTIEQKASLDNFVSNVIDDNLSK